MVTSLATTKLQNPAMPALRLNVEQVMTRPSSSPPCSGVHYEAPPTHAKAAYHPQVQPEEGTLSVLFLIPVAIAIILFSSALAILIVRIQRRKEALNAAFECEVPPPYEDVQPPAYSDEEALVAELEGCDVALEGKL
ncbi:hypothetical protein LTR85_010405 [Meristemomyces frigidus]|nr:hypothetical protein LTR85_010405 [Meristemomyces frigidus]